MFKIVFNTNSKNIITSIQCYSGSNLKLIDEVTAKQLNMKNGSNIHYVHVNNKDELNIVWSLLVDKWTSRCPFRECNLTAE